MKERITGVHSFMYEDRYIVQVHRQLSRYTMPRIRTYTVDYSNANRVVRLVSHYLDLVSYLQISSIEDRLQNYAKERSINEQKS